ncbi:hypothetical protein J6590_084394 [Homalodisca vitripennis]|nr:hypothetical protein J6590_084394 [Homalodisca vitripennis]
MSSVCGICGISCDGVDNEQKVKCAGSCENFFHVRCIHDDDVGIKTHCFIDWKCKLCCDVSTTSTGLLEILQEFKSQLCDEMKTTKNYIYEDWLKLCNSCLTRWMNNSYNEKYKEVEVSGIPETPREDVLSLVKDVGTESHTSRKTACLLLFCSSPGG